MALATGKTTVEVEVDDIKITGQTLATSRKSEIRQQSFIVVTRKTVDADTEKESTTESVVFSEGLYHKGIWSEMILGLSDNAVDLSGEKLKCDKESLGDLFDWNEGFAMKSIKKLSAAFSEILSGELKNLKRGADGTFRHAERVAKSAKNKS